VGEFFCWDIGAGTSDGGSIGDDVSQEVVKLLLDSLHMLVLVYQGDKVGTAMVPGSLVQVRSQRVKHHF
jgi:hypothetical protein